MAATSGSLKAFNETSSSIKMLDIVQETYGGERGSPMMAGNIELELASK
jgi:hypothetical protein